MDDFILVVELDCRFVASVREQGVQDVWAGLVRHHVVDAVEGEAIVLDARGDGIFCFEDAGDSEDGVVREGLGCGL